MSFVVQGRNFTVQSRGKVLSTFSEHWFSLDTNHNGKRIDDKIIKKKHFCEDEFPSAKTARIGKLKKADGISI